MFQRVFNKAKVKVYIAGFFYTTIISTACYIVKSHDGISASGETGNQLLDAGNTRAVTIVTAIHNRRIDGNNLGLKYSIKDNIETKKISVIQEIEKRVENIIEDGVFWSREVERLLPKGTTEEEYHSFLHAIDSQQVRVAEKGTKKKCSNSSPMNKYIELDNGMKMCARSKNFKKYLEGEVLSFYIARILGLDNVPPVKMVLYKRNSYPWKNVKNQTEFDIWGEEQIITLTQWIEGLEDAMPLPQVLQQCIHNRTTLTSRNIQALPLNEITPVKIIDLVQMSDLIIFDFIIQHGDRILRNKVQHDHPPKWRGGHCYLWSPVKNLGIQKNTLQNHYMMNKFWLIDNEAANAATNRTDPEFEVNEEIMKTMCIFRRSTIENIKIILEDGNPYKTIFTEISKHDRVFLEFLYGYKTHTFDEKLNQTLLGRMTEVLRWVSQCQLKMKP